MIGRTSGAKEGRSVTRGGGGRGCGKGKCGEPERGAAGCVFGVSKGVNALFRKGERDFERADGGATEGLHSVKIADRRRRTASIRGASCKASAAMRDR